jgi:hypothetical protein
MHDITVFAANQKMYSKLEGRRFLNFFDFGSLTTEFRLAKEFLSAKDRTILA